MTTARCDYCGRDSDSRLVKEVFKPEWPDAGLACYVCRADVIRDHEARQNAWNEWSVMVEQDRIDAARWRALRPLLMLVTEELPVRWVELKCVPFRSGGTVDEIVDKLAQIAQEQKP